MKTNIFKNPIVKSILSALAIAGFGFLLLNLTFIFDFLFQSLARSILGFFVPFDPEEMNIFWLPPILHALFVLIIGLISWFIFKSKLGVIYKAVYLTVPVAVVLATIGMFLYRWPVVSFLAGGLIVFGILYYFYRTKQPWLYYYAVILVTTTLMTMNLLDVKI